METTLTFKLTEKEQARSFVWMIRELNESGVPYSVSQDEEFVTLEIGSGY